MQRMKRRRIRSRAALFFVMFILFLQFAPILAFAQVQPWQGDEWGDQISPWKLDEWKGEGTKAIEQQEQLDKWQMQQWYLQTMPNASTWEAEKWASEQWQMQQWYLKVNPNASTWEAKQWAFQQWQLNQWQMQGQTDQGSWEGEGTAGDSHRGDAHQGEGTTGEGHSGDTHQGDETAGEGHSGEGTEGTSKSFSYDPDADGFTSYDGIKYAVNDALLKQVALGTDMVKGEYYQVINGESINGTNAFKGSGSWKEFLISSVKVASSNNPYAKEAADFVEAGYKTYDAYSNFQDFKFLSNTAALEQTRIREFMRMAPTDGAFYQGARRVLPKIGVGMGAVGLGFSTYETVKNVGAAINADNGYDRAESIGKTISSVGEMVASAGTMGMMTPAGAGLMAVGAGLFVAGYAVQGVTKLIKNREKIKEKASALWNGAKGLFGFGK
ncbi:hypothetical protein [Priestia abyssalis]|uniref:hypothetical protein n=1 Tax=Priestia abyssalis TaxID=1221450 RepID=UPI000994B5CC|nr:hypothetical protein [Priestia abyssalis]